MQPRGVPTDDGPARGSPATTAPPGPGSRPAAAACLPCRRTLRRRRPDRCRPRLAPPPRRRHGRRGTTPTDWRLRRGRGRSSRRRRFRRSPPNRFLTARRIPELMAALAFEIEHRIDHVFEHRARPGDLAFFGDVADEHDGGRAAWRTGSVPGLLARTWATVPGAESSAVDIHGLDRIDDHQGGAARVRRVVQCGEMSRTAVSAASSTAVRSLKAQRSACAEPDLAETLPRRRYRRTRRLAIGQ